ncbi:MAG TPA: protein kinase [Mycobacteriales bacterium]|nr:protein kinase [Mycobacteriales bacterium]
MRWRGRGDGAGRSTDLLGLAGYADAEVVAVGGSSTVWRARETALDRLVAVKVLALPVLDDRLRRRFERELAVAGRLSDHPHVVTTYASGFTADGRPYVTSEWCPGGSLAARLAEQGTRPAEEVLRTGARLATALAAAHAAGVVHRDVKPQNVLVTAYGEPALADFGIAVVVAEGTAATDALTPVHAAPEVLQGATATPAADVWGLGSTLWTLLAGAPPFAPRPGEGVLAAMVRVLEEPLPALPPGTAPPLAAALQRLLDKDPAARPPAAEVPELLHDVERRLSLAPTTTTSALPGPVSGRPAAPVVEEAATRIRPDRPLPAPAPVARRRRWPWYLAGGITAVLVALTVLGAVTDDPAPSPTAGPEPSPTTVAPADAAQPPQEVRVVADDGEQVELAWTDTNGGALPYVVDPGDGPVQPASRPDGATVTGLDPAAPYCFSVGTVFRAGAAPLYVEPVCVRGGAPG